MLGLVRQMRALLGHWKNNVSYLICISDIRGLLTRYFKRGLTCPNQVRLQRDNEHQAQQPTLAKPPTTNGKKNPNTKNRNASTHNVLTKTFAISSPWLPYSSRSRCTWSSHQKRASPPVPARVAALPHAGHDRCIKVSNIDHAGTLTW